MHGVFQTLLHITALLHGRYKCLHSRMGILLHGLYVVRYQTSEGLKTLLFSPSDIEGNRETPFFKQLSERSGPFSDMVDKCLAPKINSVEDALA